MELKRVPAIEKDISEQAQNYKLHESQKSPDFSKIKMKTGPPRYFGTLYATGILIRAASSQGKK